MKTIAQIQANMECQAADWVAKEKQFEPLEISLGKLKVSIEEDDEDPSWVRIQAEMNNEWVSAGFELKDLIGLPDDWLERVATELTDKLFETIKKLGANELRKQIRDIVTLINP